MVVARRSGIVVNPGDVPVILGMVSRGDRRHDIAAWFGLNQGRIKEVEDGAHGSPPTAPATQLPPSGSPGPKARALRLAVDAALAAIQKGDEQKAIQMLVDGIKKYDANK